MRCRGRQSAATRSALGSPRWVPGAAAAVKQQPWQQPPPITRAAPLITTPLVASLSVRSRSCSEQVKFDVAPFVFTGFMATILLESLCNWRSAQTHSVYIHSKIDTTLFVPGRKANLYKRNGVVVFFSFSIPRKRRKIEDWWNEMATVKT